MTTTIPTLTPGDVIRRADPHSDVVALAVMPYFAGPASHFLLHVLLAWAGNSLLRAGIISSPTGFARPDFVLLTFEVPDREAALDHLRLALDTELQILPFCELAWFDRRENIWRHSHCDKVGLRFDRFLADDYLRAAQEEAALLKERSASFQRILSAQFPQASAAQDPENPA